jgi:hypothetical protein
MYLPNHESRFTQRHQHPCHKAGPILNRGFLADHDRVNKEQTEGEEEEDAHIWLVAILNRTAQRGA